MEDSNAGLADIVPMACVSEPLCVGMNFATNAKAHPNTFKPLQSTQQIRRNGNIYCAVNIALRPTYPTHDIKTPRHRRIQMAAWTSR